MDKFDESHIGKKVRIKSLDELYKEDPFFRDDPPLFVDEMDKYAGKYAKIIQIFDKDAYLDIDNIAFAWSPRWLEIKPTISIDDELFEL